MRRGRCLETFNACARLELFAPVNGFGGRASSIHPSLCASSLAANIGITFGVGSAASPSQCSAGTP
eukprot:3744033-Pyramimonas_sp.AAC.1